MKSLEKDLIKNIEEFGICLGSKKTALSHNLKESTCYRLARRLVKENLVKPAKIKSGPKTRFYTDVEINLIKRVVSENVDNLQRAFRILAVELGTTAASLSQYWYNGAKNDNHPLQRFNIGTCFLLVGKRKAYINTKVIADGYSFMETDDIQDTKSEVNKLCK